MVYGWRKGCKTNKIKSRSLQGPCLQVMKTMKCSQGPWTPSKWHLWRIYAPSKGTIQFRFLVTKRNSDKRCPGSTLSDILGFFSKKLKPWFLCENSQLYINWWLTPLKKKHYVGTHTHIHTWAARLSPLVASQWPLLWPQKKSFSCWPRQLPRVQFQFRDSVNLGPWGKSMNQDES